MSHPNRQIVSSIASLTVLNVANAPAVAMGMTMTMMADSISIAMENATNAQRNMQTIANSSTTTCCALIISKVGSG